VLGPAEQAAADLGIEPDIALRLQRVAQAVVDPDTTPPVTTVNVSEAPNANGWNRGDVTIGFSAVDEPGGSMVDAIRYAAEGAQPGSGAFGASGSLTITAEGVTTVTYYAIDRAGNAEAPRTIRVAIDRTPPAITGMPGAACSLWPPNDKMVTVATVSAADGTSGLASFVVGATSNEAPTKLNEADTLVQGAGFGARTVSLRASRQGNGTGRVYTVTASAGDAAGNATTVSAQCVVPHNR
jgi:hypothetical protein